MGESMVDEEGSDPAALDVPAFGIHDGATMVECSPELARMFGYASTGDMIGHPPLQFVDPAHRDQSIIEVMSKGGGPYSSVGLRGDGVRFRIEISAHAIQHNNSEARLVLVRDMSPKA